MSLHPSLTTAFTAPPDCTSRHYLAGTFWSTYIQETLQQSSSCFAPGWTSAVNKYAKGSNTWSGVPICPTGQSVAATTTDVNSQVTAICCSSNWGNVFTNGNPVSGTVYQFWVCQSSFSVSATTVAMPTDMTGQTVVKGTGALESTAEYLFVYNRAQVTPTSSAGSTTSSSAFLASSTSGSPNPNNLSIPDSRGPTLNTGAKVGIAVAVVVAVLAILGVAVFCLFKRRQRRSDMTNIDKQDYRETWQPNHGRHELHGVETSEPSGKMYRHELDSRKVIAELPTG